MKKLNKAAKVLSKICEVGLWIGVVGMIIFFCAINFAENTVTNAIMSGLDGNSLTITGVNFEIIDGNGNLSVTALKIALFSSIFIIALIAMIFRNVYLIFKKSETESPFANDNVRMVREIGIFSIAIPVIELIAAIVGGIIGGGVVNVSINLVTIVFGIVMLCLSQFFAYGASLEHDVDGLL